MTVEGAWAQGAAEGLPTPPPHSSPRPAALASSVPLSRGFGATRLANAPPPVMAVAAGRPAVTGVELHIPFTLASADGLTTDFTNYVRGYKGALDYVWWASQ